MQKAAILVNNGERLQEGLIAGQNLSLNGIRVHIFLIDSTSLPAEKADGPSTVDQGPGDTQRFTHRPDIAGRYGFRHAGLAQIALMLKEADIVIPF